jgi:hypothetical protein
MCLFEDRIEHRRQIAGRSVDHLQDFGCRSLLLQRFLLFRKQSRVLHRDRRLICEGTDKVYLSVGERFNSLAREYEKADRITITQERHAERGSLLAELGGR